MAEAIQVVVRTLKGDRIKGTTQDFYPERLTFHVQQGSGQTALVKMADLKAVFFVRDLAGNPAHVKGRKFGPMDPGLASGKRIAVLFKDDELLVGYTTSYVAGRLGFFLIPADKAGNNSRVYVLSHACKMVRLGPAADELVQTAPQPKPKPRPRAA